MTGAEPPDWQSILTTLLAEQHLTRAEAAWAMGQIMAAEATDAQIAAFVVALRAKGEDADEVAGLVDAMLDHAVRVAIPQPALDIVGTGGDRSHSVNISTMAAIVAAAAGAVVVKHGNRAASSQCGSADVLAALGVAVDLGPEQVSECVSELGIGFCFAPRFHPAMRHAAGPRREIGIPTVFNVLGPLANPAQPASALIGCADRRMAPVMAAVLAGRGQRSLVVRGEDGLDEVTTAGITAVWDATAGDGTVREGGLDAAALGVEAPPEGALRGGDAELNAGVARAVLDGAAALGGRPMLPVRDAVLLNAAVALVADAAARGEDSQRPVQARVLEQWGRAAEAIDSGAARDLLARWVELSNRL